VNPFTGTCNARYKFENSNFQIIKKRNLARYLFKLYSRLLSHASDEYNICFRCHKQAVNSSRHLLLFYVIVTREENIHCSLNVLGHINSDAIFVYRK
jgi:hypothetical protein